MTETTKGTTRTQVAREYLRAAESNLNTELLNRLDQKGYGTFTSKHEIYGVLAEEVFELLQAIQANAPLHVVQNELRDIAVTCLFGDACILADTLDW